MSAASTTPLANSTSMHCHRPAMHEATTPSTTTTSLPSSSYRPPSPVPLVGRLYLSTAMTGDNIFLLILSIALLFGCGVLLLFLVSARFRRWVALNLGSGNSSRGAGHGSDADPGSSGTDSSDSSNGSSSSDIPLRLLRPLPPVPQQDLEGGPSPSPSGALPHPSWPLQGPSSSPSSPSGPPRQPTSVLPMPMMPPSVHTATSIRTVTPSVVHVSRPQPIPHFGSLPPHSAQPSAARQSHHSMVASLYGVPDTP